MNYRFPNHLIDPQRKNEDWILQYCKAAWYHNSGANIGSYWNNAYRYQYISDYAQGKQSINQYKEQLGIDSRSDESWVNINWEVLPILPKFLDMALARLKRFEYNIVATPVDPQSKIELNEFFKTQKAKIELRKEAENINPELAATLKPQEGEPEDLEELNIMRAFTYKHQLASEAEIAVETILEQNHFEDERLSALESALFFGIVGYKEEVGEDGKIYCRTIDPRQLLMSPSVRKDFKDTEYVGEVLHLTIADLRRLSGNQFSEAQLEDIAQSYMDQFGNPSRMPRTNIYSRAYDDFKIRVMDIEFDSTNMMTYERSFDKRGNQLIARANMNKAGKNKKNGDFVQAPVGVVYRAKWIIGTDYIFDYGLLRDMKRSNSDLRKTSKSYHIRAYSNQGGRIVGKTEQCIPVVDSIMMAWYRLQQAVAEARPNGFSIDLDALEDIPLGRGGSDSLSPYETLELFLQKGVMPYRTRDLDGNRTHYMPVNAIQGGLGNAAAEYYAVIQQNMQILRDILGFSEVSEGNAPERMLTTVAKLSDQATEDSLSPIANAEKLAFESMVNALMQRLQSVMRNNPKNYINAIGQGSAKFISLSPELSMRDLAIKLENKPDAQEKEILLQYATKYMDAGLVSMEDLVMIRNTQNLKQAEMLLSYRMKKRREEIEQQAQQQSMMNGQIQQQSAMMAEQAKQQTLQLEYQLKMELLKLEKEYDMQIAAMSNQNKMQVEAIKAGSNIESTTTKAESDEYRAELLANAARQREESKVADDMKRK
jgi:hypothetical protein